jgi:polyhydroxybutyrate depolymerase
MRLLSRPLALPLLLSLLSLASCSKASSTADAHDAAPPTNPLIVARPYDSVIPDSYDASKPTPLVILLHGYATGGLAEEALFQLTPGAQEHGFLYAYPDGTPDSSNHRFWNATDACCNFDHVDVDDVAYVNAIIDDMSAQYNVDPKRIFLIGHSNGGFMSHRFACDRTPRVAAIVSLAGAEWKDPARCVPTDTVSVLQVHGDQDQEIGYDGGVTQDHTGATFAYPSAHDTVATWAAKNGCADSLTTVGTLDVDVNIPGNETTQERYTGCKNGAVVELWTVHGAGHTPGLSSTWRDLVWGFMSAHPKP